MTGDVCHLDGSISTDLECQICDFDKKKNGLTGLVYQGRIRAEQ